MTEFKNTEIAFARFNDKELKKIKRVFSLVANPKLTKAGKALVSIAATIKVPYAWAVIFIYRQFVGGKDLQSCLPVVNGLYKSNVHSIPDFSAEGQNNEAFFEKVCNEVINSIKMASDHKPKIPFAVFKPTGIARFELLEKITSKTALRDRERSEWEETKKRFHRIAEAAKRFNVPVMIDAEESWIQAAVDDLYLQLCRKYNTNQILIFNTVQMYRNDRTDYLKLLFMQARKDKFKVGLKLVRGAYHEKEIKRSIEVGYKCPVYREKQETDDAYNNALKLCMENIDMVSVMCASHNENSNMLLMQLANKSQLNTDDSRVWFAQLYGMSDNITFILAAENYNVAKYLPYGSIETVIPYLLRRAEENTSSRGQSSRELMLVKSELERRKKAQ